MTCQREITQVLAPLWQALSTFIYLLIAARAIGSAGLGIGKEDFGDAFENDGGEYIVRIW